MVYGPPAVSLLEHGHVRATHLLLYQVFHSTPLTLTDTVCSYFWNRQNGFCLFGCMRGLSKLIAH